MSSVIEDIKSRLNIVDVASGYLKLEKAGGNFKACCPFHSERTPSFFISPSRQTYHCFGCNKGGDIISFVEEVEGLDFQGALKLLADKAGVTLTREKAGAKDERDAIHSALLLATKFYEAVLPKFPDALTYIENRGLTSETIKNFHVGFAPDEWRALGDFLAKKGISESVMERAGLIVRSPKGFYDRFRGRVMFPITDSSGRVIAFSGRILKEEAGKTLGASASAKYVNSPETEVFHKSRALFGFYQAREKARHDDVCILVEGQMDLILSHQAGATNTVASSGTALTPEHLEMIKRFTKNIILALDADKAGLSATHRAIELALDQDMDVKIAQLPDGLDPADLILKDPALWQNAIKNARHVIDFYLELLPELYTDKDTLRAKISEIVIPFIPHLKGSLDQAHFVGKIADLIKMKEDPIWDEVKKRAKTVGVVRETEKLEQKVAQLSRYTRISRTIEGVLVWQAGLENPSVNNISEYRERFTKLIEGSPPVEVVNGDELIFEAEARLQGSEKIEEELNSLLKSLAEEILREKFTVKMAELKQAEINGDVSDAEKILSECQAISKELHTLTKNTL
ncbi:MAG: primase protein [Parcubacteria group bacterium GW2011_GWC1_42_11]|uniref:DNA primase n=1 Tax=Candidatus Nomurabacteria bacterium GW2011_GWC2_42_20 TaxID=1618756 RepID=A0A0G0ZF75_9BACT|nr:MAG: primase protein [Parcubacteria group bacterium GW2011_GWC1_42_11]KKS47377.1 MAG: primase protein [Candidatus Nomurabacteria bacterium GW2011_GWC2_42_20]KKT09322.1 MAG: primase protein [Candidatus Nomurabacteria bacterium GW2011_GWB1_43_20]TAN35822.1 MAG: DNA primase [Patescibacteria group bacterium]HBH71588.1 DNA primase [Candidatus Yonathbacteria bacterium]